MCPLLTEPREGLGVALGPSGSRLSPALEARKAGWAWASAVPGPGQAPAAPRARVLLCTRAAELQPCPELQRPRLLGQPGWAGPAVRAPGRRGSPGTPLWR